MEKTLEEGYAFRLRPKKFGSGPVNYLPIFGINKKGCAAVKIVLEAATRFKENYFNDRVPYC